MTQKGAFAPSAIYFLAWLVAGACCLNAAPATAAPKKVCSPAEKADANKWLWLNSHDKQQSIKDNLPWGVPAPRAPVSNEVQLIQREYVIDYDADLRIPVWTAERIVASDIGKVGRSDCFRRDVRLKAADASDPSDYREPIFDQGHMTPSGDVTVSKRAVHNSFIMSNMSPQFCEFNRGIWQILEEQVRRWAKDRGTIYVTNGSVFDRDGNGVRDADDAATRMVSNNHKIRVAVPTAFYKIIAVKHPDGSIETLSILLPHDHSDLDGDAAMTYLQQHITTVAAIEQLTGLDFFPQQSSAITETQALWPYNHPLPRSLATRC